MKMQEIVPKSDERRFNEPTAVRDVGPHLPDIPLGLASAMMTMPGTVYAEGQVPILFSAPHGLEVWRGGKAGERARLHYRERWVTELVVKLSQAVGYYVAQLALQLPVPEARRLLDSEQVSTDAAKARNTPQQRWNKEGPRRRAGSAGERVRAKQSVVDEVLASGSVGFSGCSYVVWNCLTALKQDPANLDPNFLLEQDFDKSDWHKVLHKWLAAHEHRQAAPLDEPTEEDAVSRLSCLLSKLPAFHIDVHGKVDRRDNMEIDLGTGAAEALLCRGDSTIPVMWKTVLQAELQQSVFDSSKKYGSCQMPFAVQVNPDLKGYRKNGFSTYAQQSAVLGVPSMQLELPRTMRKALMSEAGLFDRFSRAIGMFYVKAIALGPRFDGGPTLAARSFEFAAVWPATYVPRAPASGQRRVSLDTGVARFGAGAPLPAVQTVLAPPRGHTLFNSAGLEASNVHRNARMGRRIINDLHAIGYTDAAEKMI